MLRRNGCGRRGGVCAGMLSTSGHILNQRVNTTAPVENEAHREEAERSWIRDGEVVPWLILQNQIAAFASAEG